MKHFVPRLSFSASLMLLCLVASGTMIRAQEAQPQPAQQIAPVQQVVFAGNTAVSSEDLQRAAGIRTGEPLTPQMLAEAINRIQAAYTERGYIADFVYYEIEGQQPPRTLTFRIREVKVSAVEIIGLTTTREETVRRFIPIKPGDLYNQRVVADAVTRLYGLNIFEDVQVFLRESGQPGQVILAFQFKEMKTQRVDLGGSLEPTGRLVLRADYINANFRGRAEQLSGDVNIGTISGQIGGSVSYFNPAAPTPNKTLFLRAYSDVNVRFGSDLVNQPGSNPYSERRTGVQSVWNNYLRRNRQIAYGFRFDNADVKNFPTAFVPGDIPSPGGWVAIPSARYSRDGRVTLVFPVSGSYSMVFLEPGYSNPDEGPTGFISRLQVDQRFLLPLRRITPVVLTAENPKPVPTFAVRLSGGASTGPLPFYEQFFLGGVETLRGYQESRFWGKYYFLLNNEFRWPLSRQIVGLLFADLGDAWGSDFQIAPGIPTDFEQHRDFAPRGSVGVGLWYVSPAVGTVRLVYAKGEDWRLGFAVGQGF